MESAINIPSAREQYIPQRENSVKIFLLLLMMLFSFYVMNALFPVFPFSTETLSLSSLFALGLFWLLALWVSMLMLGMAILAHDGVHRVLFKNAALNDIASGILSALGGAVPFYANRQYHLTHHSYTHQGETDPEHIMHNKPFWQAFIIGSFIGLYLQYKIMLTNFVRGFSDQKYLFRALKDFFFIAIAAVFYFVCLPGMGISPLYSIVPAFLIFPITFAYRALSDHYGLPRVKRKSERFEEVLENSDSENEKIMRDSTKQATGWVVHTSPWLEWLWSHVNYHEVHHKFPYLSHIHLPTAFAATRNSHAYREVKGFTHSLFQLSHKTYYQEDGR